ncbi:MAG: InlB B-repeat-containing protein, partial [Firmicutes bacterium]|nr:InlB B-repeat-containing protein [Bacillota bacterium]
MLKKLTNKIFALSLAFAFASAFLLAACGSGAANPDKEYTVTFVTGVIGWVVEPLVGKAGAPVTAPVAPDREGYKFGGWTYNGQDYALSVMPSRNITLSAKWNRIFTITFNSAGGSEVMPVVAAETERIAAPPDPVYEGHKFSYWTLDGARFYFTAMPSRDITLTAVWAEAVTIRFDTGVAGVAAPPPMVEVPGAPIAAPAAPKNPGFVLSGWYDGETLFRFPATMPDEDLTLTAKWVAGGVIKFLSGIEGVASPDDLIALPGAAISAPDTRTLRPGYHAEGWYRTDGRLFIFNTMPSSAMSEPITLTAKWVEGSKLPALIVTMREENGALIPITDERFGPTPWNQGYPFSSTKAKVQYVPCSIGISGAGGGSLAEAVPGVFKPKGNGSFRPDPTAKRPYRLKFDKKQSVFGWPKSK